MSFFGRLFGKGRGEPAPPRAQAPTGGGGAKAWIIGTSAWGGVLLECGQAEMVLLLLPIADAEPYRAMPEVPAGMIKAIIAFDARRVGVLAVEEVARRTGRPRVYTMSAAAPMPQVLRFGPLMLERRGDVVLAIWNDGTTAMVGDAIRFADLAAAPAHNVVGGIVAVQGVPDGFVDALIVMRRVVLLANLPGVEADLDAQLMAQLGVTAEVVNQPPPPVRTRVIAHLIRGELDEADQLAADAIGRGEQVADMHFQRAIAALLRSDEDAALRELEAAAPAMVEARNSLAAILARRKDPRAVALAREAVDSLPTDPIAIRNAVLVHALAGDRAGAEDLLARHGAHLSPDERAALAASLDAPQLGADRFPEHAKLAQEVATGMIDAGRHADAEPLLRRALVLDRESPELVAELGYCLSQLGRDADAIAVYDEAIGRGGAAVLLRFNRGNCHLRVHRFTPAIADFRGCLALKADWHEARVNLVSALFASGDRAAARAELDVLRRNGGAAEHVAALEQMLS